MRPKKITLALTAADANGICTTQTVAAAADLALNGALYKADKVARFGVAAAVRITSSGDESGITFTVYGLDTSGNSISEIVTGPNATTADTNQSFKTVQRVITSASTTGNITVGNAVDDNGVCLTQTVTGVNGLLINGVMARSCTMYGIATLVPAQVVKIVSAGNDAGVTFTVYGRDADGVEIQENITGAAIGTATGTTLFTEVIAVYADGAPASTITVGVLGDLNTICESQSISAPGYAIFNGDYCTTQARHVSITAVSDETAKTFTVAGLNRNGNPLSEVITGPGAGLTVKGVKNFSVIHTVRASAALTGNVTVGSADECDSQLFPLNTYTDSLAYQIVRSSDANFDHRIGLTVENVLNRTVDEYTATYSYPTGWASADEFTSRYGALSGVRLGVKSFVLGTVEMTVINP